jgi:transcriptional regulator with XRE-family HTH domain
MSSIEEGMMHKPMMLSNGLHMTAFGERIRLERVQRRLSLERVAERAGVSRSMLSAVERGLKVPTVLVLDRIATALDTSIARLLGEELAARVISLRKADQDVVRDPSGWERRILSPVLPGVEFEFMRTTIDAGVDAGAFSPHAPGSREYVAIERGTLRLTIDGEVHVLNAGDSIYYAGDCVHSFVNPGKKPCVYYLAMEVSDDASLAKHRR